MKTVDEKHTHVWTRVENVSAGTSHIECEECGEKPPADRRVVKLTVVDRLVKCPYGFTKHMTIIQPDGSKVKKKRPLHDCYLDSLTPGHRCNDPEETGAKRCPHVKKLVAKHGLRTYDRQPVVHHERRGVLHQDWPLRIIYAPLDVRGRKWMAVNTHTGQRHLVVLHKEAPHRRTPEGEDIRQQYDRTILTINGLMMSTRRVTPPWTGVVSRDQFRCNCKNCVKGIWPMRNKLQGVNLDAESEQDVLKNEPPVLVLKNAPSAKTKALTVKAHIEGQPNTIETTETEVVSTMTQPLPTPTLALHAMWDKDPQGRNGIGPIKVTGRFKTQKDYEDAKRKADQAYTQRVQNLKPKAKPIHNDDDAEPIMNIGSALSSKMRDNINKKKKTPKLVVVKAKKAKSKKRGK